MQQLGRKQAEQTWIATLGPLRTLPKPMSSAKIPPDFASCRLHNHFTPSTCAAHQHHQLFMMSVARPPIPGPLQNVNSNILVAVQPGDVTCRCHDYFCAAERFCRRHAPGWQLGTEGVDSIIPAYQVFAPDGDRAGQPQSQVGGTPLPFPPKPYHLQILFLPW